VGESDIVEGDVIPYNPYDGEKSNITPEIFGIYNGVVSREGCKVRNNVKGTRLVTLL
jgi:hypothetical protein